jgi:hypothetical protein
MRETRCFVLVRSVRRHYTVNRFGQSETSEPERFVAELFARGTSGLLYKSKPCETVEAARKLAEKYVARHPEYVVA